MSFTTRCPSCGTVFRVVADQLKISDGWVRCGHCTEVFDATIDLDAWLPPGPGAAPPPPVAGSLPAGGRPQAPPAAQPIPVPAAAEETDDSGDLPSDDDLRAWFGDGPLDPPDALRLDSPRAEHRAEDDLDGFEPLESWDLSASAPQQQEPRAPIAPVAPVAPFAPLMPSLAEATVPPAEAAVPPAEAADGSAALQDEPVDPPLVLPEPEAPQPSSDPLDVPSVSSMLTVASQDEAWQDDPCEPSDFEAELARFAHSSRTPLVGADTDAAATPPAVAGDAAGDAVPAQSAPAAQPEEAEEAEEAGREPGAEAPVPGFVRQAQRQAFWSSRGMRATLSALVLLLGLLLAGQWAYHGRHELVAAQPALKPWVLRACDWLGCDLAPVRRIDAIEIESADLVRRLGDFYSFDIVLRNRSALEVAPPALELSLTDGGGAVVSRRVFLPQDWPEAVPFLPPKDRVSLSLRLSIALGEGVPTAGYRALVFYP